MLARGIEARAINNSLRTRFALVNRLWYKETCTSSLYRERIHMIVVYEYG